MQVADGPAAGSFQGSTGGAFLKCLPKSVAASRRCWLKSKMSAGSDTGLCYICSSGTWVLCESLFTKSDLGGCSFSGPTRCTGTKIWTSHELGHNLSLKYKNNSPFLQIWGFLQRKQFEIVSLIDFLKFLVCSVLLFCADLKQQLTCIKTWSVIIIKDGHYVFVDRCLHHSAARAQPVVHSRKSAQSLLV